MTWSELVTTALLGTDRRAVPDLADQPWALPASEPPADPAQRVLELAARHRAWTAVLAAPTPPLDAAAKPVPAADRAPAPPRAAALLGDLLVRPEPALVNAWLGWAVATGTAPPPSQWTRLIRLASRSTAYERRRLGEALGARGRWFLAQNPEWRRLAADAEPGSADQPEPDQAPDPGVVRSRPETVFGCPEPWPAPIVAAALAVLGEGRLGRRARDYAVRVGARLPIEAYPSVAPAAAYYLGAPDAPPALRRAIREAFVLLELAAWTRIEISRAFAPELDTPRRSEVPHV